MTPTPFDARVAFLQAQVERLTQERDEWKRHARRHEALYKLSRQTPTADTDQMEQDPS